MAWLAGLLEGEGSFYMLTSHVGGKPYRYPKIVVNMTDQDVIEHVARILGGSVYTMPKAKKFPDRKQQWRAQASGSNAATWMRRLRPMMSARRQAKIEEILAEYGTIEPTEVRRQRACSEAAALRPRVNGRFVAR